MCSRCASTQARPAMRRINRRGEGRAGDDGKQLEAEGVRRDQRAADEDVAEQARGQRRDRDAHNQARQRQRHVEPHQRGQRRRRHQARRRHLQHQHEEQAGHALCRGRARRNSVPSTAGTISMTQTVAAAISPGRVKWWRSSTGSTRRKASASMTTMASPRNGLQAAASAGTARPTNSEAATTSVPLRPTRRAWPRAGREVHGWETPAARLGLRRLIAPSAAMFHIVGARKGTDGTHGCHRARRRHCRHLGRAASRQARARASRWSSAPASASRPPTATPG